MQSDRDLLKQALEALELHAKQYPHMQKGYTVDAITALRERLAQPEQEPPLPLTDQIAKSWSQRELAATTPQPRQWVGLTDALVDELAREMVKGDKSVNWLARAIEAAHGIKE